ncbi:hypothetical protein V9T40_001816 [Parthenolecanium corni]|uniref:Uncharacterized protein n=1 Tax=Parthenolecanium corni TaxID=536013 RepID=A0AAN9TF25_9HEMI
MALTLEGSGFTRLLKGPGGVIHHFKSNLNGPGGVIYDTTKRKKPKLTTARPRPKPKDNHCLNDGSDANVDSTSGGAKNFVPYNQYVNSNLGSSFNVVQSNLVNRFYARPHSAYMDSTSQYGSEYDYTVSRVYPSNYMSSVECASEADTRSLADDIANFLGMESVDQDSVDLILDASPPQVTNKAAPGISKVTRGAEITNGSVNGEICNKNDEVMKMRSTTLVSKNDARCQTRDASGLIYEKVTSY